MMPHAATNLECLFEQASTLSGEEQLSLLQKLGRTDPGLQRQLAALLQADKRSDEFFARDPAQLASGGTFHTSSSAIPERIEPYKLVQKLGEGGCGCVYLAEQSEPIHRRVALKIVKAGMDTASVIARFEGERQALAMMDHPNIAKVFDAGSTHTGRPYFVMELVDGQKITDYCLQHQLSIKDRILLFLQICDAVQHAHQKGIIHRDLKPSNILVQTLSKPSPRPPWLPSFQNTAFPKIIDFGIAKSLSGSLAPKTQTLQHQFLGTPAYMSPEQANLSPDIDTRTDIYSLGVLLYELLTGRPPFDNHELLTAGLDEMRRIIREVEPKPPSHLSPTSNHLSLSTDLDCIILKCLEKDRARRYESSSAIAADLQRYLSDEPISARPPAAAYKAWKFIQRNKLAFASVVAVSLALILGLLASAREALRANRAEEQFRQQAILAQEAEQAQSKERAQAEQQLKLTLGFLDQLFRDTGGKLWQIAGTSEVSEMLATNAVALLDQLRAGASLTTNFQLTVANQYVRLAGSAAWYQGNSSADYVSGLNLANQAISLFETLPRETLSPDSIRQLARVEIIAGVASERLFCYDSAIEHLRKAEHWATLLTNYAAFASDGLTLSAAIPGGCIGDVLLRMGRVDEALTNNFLPFLRAMEGRQLSETNPNVFVLAHLYAAHVSVARALSALDRHEPALPHRREALRLMQLVLKVEPHAAEFLSTLPIAFAELGESLLAGGNLEGLEALHQAQAEAKALLERDSRNAGFMETQIEVLRLSASSLALYAGGYDLTNLQRQARLREAEDHFVQAEQALKLLKSQDQRQWLAVDLNKTRRLLLATSARNASEQVGETRGPPAPFSQ